jgi:hypothetical protein
MPKAGHAHIQPGKPSGLFAGDRPRQPLVLQFVPHGSQIGRQPALAPGGGADVPRQQPGHHGPQSVAAIARMAIQTATPQQQRGP